MLTNETLEMWAAEAESHTRTTPEAAAARIRLLIIELNEAQETICDAAKLLCDACPEIREQMGERLVELLDRHDYRAAA